MGAEIAHHHGVAVGRGARGLGGADRAAGAGHVFDDDLLAEHRTDRLRDDAAEDVGRPARGERHDHGDGAVGILLFGPRMHAGVGYDNARYACDYREPPHGAGPCHYLPPAIEAPRSNAAVALREFKGVRGGVKCPCRRYGRKQRP